MSWGVGCVARGGWDVWWGWAVSLVGSGGRARTSTKLALAAAAMSRAREVLPHLGGGVSLDDYTSTSLLLLHYYFTTTTTRLAAPVRSVQQHSARRWHAEASEGGQGAQRAEHAGGKRGTGGHLEQRRLSLSGGDLGR